MTGPWITSLVAILVAVVSLALCAYLFGKMKVQPSLVPDGFVAAAQAQADAMALMANRTAEGLRAANGTYVFALRDRFDESLVPLQLGVSDTSWEAMGDAPGAVEELVFHANDVVRFCARVALNQTPEKRLVSLRWLHADGVVPSSPLILTAGGRQIGVEAGELPRDTTAFLDLPVDFALTENDLAQYAAVDRRATAELVVTDTRAEGAVVRHELHVIVRGHLQPDDDGVALEAPSVEVTIGPEERRWYLNKAANLALALPGHVDEVSLR